MTDTRRVTFIQICSSAPDRATFPTVHGLDADGRVWVYSPLKHVWQSYPPIGLTPTESTRD